ncbi:PHD domain-containing protein/Helicase_C_4 domain-containing protein/AAA_34 domain-containing protein [Cephalotus follicularis]|uniref:PHD domain-containing protein/Helicase_C_4 domain-containing protein/AAA_34 domain-containing protein n=1 Tax=Cephalotus follicularis TaxID=3775 RepID=A0A1Q3BAU5_CEPFO|nr:PHD domain-containing protein/Helicase_C_4 domain-containing protein/AAA_34 domain-containing protein [Cephalotus follicularis]
MMTQPSVPPPPPPMAPPPKSNGVQVRCAGCRMILTVGPGVTEFVCPTCQLPQMLPPELMTPNNNIHPQIQLKPLPPPVPAHGIDPTKIQLPCAHCKAILNVPHGLSHFSCPQCGVDLAVDLSKVKQLFPPPVRPPAPVPPAVRAPAPLPSPIPIPPEEVNEVAIEVEREEDEGGTAGETFTDYRPPKLSIGPPHPDPIVETSSLSAVQPPEPTYDLKIKDDLERSEALSCLQIETLVYASQRHLHHLPNGARAGFFIGDGAGVGKGRTIAGLIWENWHHGRRKALWISVGSDLKFDARRDLDDVGAPCIGVHALNKLPYSKLDSKSVGIREGVVFLTYSSLIASSEKGRSRLQQLVQWCGPGFGGLVIFDECHKAKNLVPEAGSQPTRTGEAVLEIQARLPEARVIYCSATGASEPRNMGYMVRLGLWGTGTSFSSFQEFLVALDKGGVGALELVAMDMKARGMYVCRTLSYKGAEFEVVEAPLEAEMMEMYKKAAEFWAELRVELLSASAFLLNEKPSSSQLWRLYWSSHQRFFRHMCMSAKVPVTVRLAKQALMDDKCVVIGLQSTGEARTEEAVTKYGLELDDFISGPRELLLKFVEENYPLPEKPEPVPGEESVKELQRKRHSATPGVSFKGRVRKAAKWKPASDGESDEESESDSDPESNESDDEFQICEICNGEEERKKLIECSCCSHLFHPSCLVPPVLGIESGDWSCHSCKEKTEEYLQARHAYLAEMLKRYEAALDRKSKILEIIRSLNLPNNPLDDIIDQLGGPDKVAEMTGRRGMLVRSSSGKGVTYQARNTKDVTMEMVNMHEKQLFMDGKKSVAIISEAGSAGVSLQADRRALNQKRRVHLTLELPWSADRAIQQFGRTHRSNQASAPEYRLLFTNLGGERRFASIVAKRLESLGALTQGDRRAGPSLSAYNYDSSYGKKALVLMYRGIMEQDSLPVVPPGCSSEKPDTIQDFILKAKAALVSVGIVRDSILGNGKDSVKLSGRIIDSDMHDVGRFLNRLLGLPPDIQNRLFELFVSILDVLVQNARIEGNLDSGIVDMRANIVELEGTPKTVHVDQMSGASTVLFTFTLDRGITWESASTMLEEKQKDGLSSANDGFYESKREWLGRRHFILAFESTTSGMFKIVRPAVGESIREMPLPELKNKYRKMSSLQKARNGWEDEYEVSSKQCMHGPNCKLGNYCTVGRRLQEVNVLGGLILPVWGTIEKALSKQARLSHKRLRVVRIETTADNQRIVGLLVPNAAVETVLQDLAWVQEIDD